MENIMNAIEAAASTTSVPKVSVQVKAPEVSQTITSEKIVETYNKEARIVRHKDLMSTDCPGKNFNSSILKVVRIEEFKYKDHDKISGWAKEAVYKLRNKGIMIGDSEDNFDPKGSITREEVAKVIAKMMNLI